MSDRARKNVVVIGGGTGTHTVLKGLKRYADTLNITAVVTMADSGGSTGRLRDEFGFLPVGDARMALTALAAEVDDTDELLRQLFLYRFDRGHGLNGHNVGNLLLVALTDILGNESLAIEAASCILRVRGQVLPVTDDNVHLVAEYQNGVVVEGEELIDDPAPELANERIIALRTNPVGEINEKTKRAIAAADLIVLGPGDLYTSILANVVVGGVTEAITACRGKIVFITSLMERPGQTRGMSICDTVNELSTYLNRAPDVVLTNNAPLPQDILLRYAEEGNHPLKDDTATCEQTVMQLDLLAFEPVSQHRADSVRRSLIRHDSDKVANAILQLL